MAYADTFTGEIIARLKPQITTTEGYQEGHVSAVHDKVVSLTDGSTAGKATGFFSSSFTATTGAGITLSLASATDPLGAAGDDGPTMSAEGLKLKAIFVENTDATNFVTFKKGTNGDTAILSGSTDGIKITAGGFILWYSPAGVNAMNDGTDDEYVVIADTASVVVKLTYIFG